jgi:hypothetical protein
MHIQQTLATFEEFAAWLRSLQMEPAFWERPIAEGKWEVRDVIAHLLHWDEYLLTHTLPAVRRGKNIQFPDFDTYNHASLRYRKLSQQDVLNQQRPHASNLFTNCEICKLTHYVPTFPLTMFHMMHIPVPPIPCSMSLTSLFTMIAIIKSKYSLSSKRLSLDDFLFP